MKIAFRLILAAAVIALGAWLWTVLFPSPEKVVRHRLQELAEEVSFNGNENPLIIANRAGNLMALFATNVEVQLDVPGRTDHTFQGRDELMQALAGARASASSLRVEFIDVTVTVAPDKRSATASLTVHAKVGGEKDDFLQPMRFTLEKSGHDWLILRVETLRTLT